jgi:hypothetical protein
MDRRKWFDRRSSKARKRGAERRVNQNHREPYPIERRGILRKQSIRYPSYERLHKTFDYSKCATSALLI